MTSRSEAILMSSAPHRTEPESTRDRHHHCWHHVRLKPYNSNTYIGTVQVQGRQDRQQVIAILYVNRDNTDTITPYNQWIRTIVCVVCGLVLLQTEVISQHLWLIRETQQCLQRWSRRSGMTWASPRQTWRYYPTWWRNWLQVVNIQKIGVY